MAKTIEDLIASRTARAAIIKKFGQIPESIMAHNKNERAIDLIAENRNYGKCANDGGHESAQRCSG